MGRGFLLGGSKNVLDLDRGNSCKTVNIVKRSKLNIC